MDVLIELIVGIFRALFGEPEKPPQNEYRPPGRSQGRRGPYNYGDESGARRPKTLEEILEEVRREAAQKKGLVPPRPQPQAPPKPAAVQRAVQPAPARVEDRTLRSTLDAQRPVEAPLPKAMHEYEHVAIGRLDKPTPAAPPRPSSEPMPEQLLPHEAAAAMAAVANAPQAVATVREMQAVLVKQPTAVTAPARAFVNALRNATPQARRDAAWQAIVLAEIFGPPRSRRMGRRLI